MICRLGQVGCYGPQDGRKFRLIQATENAMACCGIGYMNHGPPINGNRVTSMLANHALIVLMRSKLFLPNGGMKNRGKELALPVVPSRDTSLRSDPQDIEVLQSKAGG